jgi:nucleotide-binding universal stress UspA family protein
VPGDSDRRVAALEADLDPEDIRRGEKEQMSGSNPPVVVGVDGSECSLEALRWGARQAELTGAELQAVMAWSLPEIYGYTPRDLEGEARKALEHALEQALGKQPRVHVVAKVVEGHAAEALIDASRDAQLLVVGSHGHGGFAGMLLGSISLRCVSHAECPVVVVR